MTKRFWLLGATDSIEDVGERLSQLLDAEMRERSSSYLGDYLRGSTAQFETIVVQRNMPDEDGRLVEEEFPDVPVLIYLTQDSEDPESPVPTFADFRVLKIKC